ncbi:superoxide dismutase family protein [Nonomuraea sp. NPDC050153]|uniref:superoxide dismutase family protein n=1 Tax=Nonomuraea sp. NPDC050153 TaxID=3364359 RepID=UPI0037B65211
MRVPALLLIMLTAACAGPPAPLQQVMGPSEGPTGGAIRLAGEGEFTASDTSAIAYDRKLAPKGAQGSAHVESADGKTRTTLVVEGLLPNRHYGAHLHDKPCGKKPEEAGPHYQHTAGEVSAASEVWLDFTTDGEGAGRSTARNDWVLDPAKLPGSLVIHAKATKTSGPEVGTAGDRVACLTLKKVS